MSDSMDAPIRRWLKSGLGVRQPPEAVRGRVMLRAASRQVGLDRRQGRLQPRWTGRSRRHVLDAWSFGLAAQTALDWFPGEMTTFRTAY